MISITSLHHIESGRSCEVVMYIIHSTSDVMQSIKESNRLAKEFGCVEVGVNVWKSSDIEIRRREIPNEEWNQEVGGFYDRDFWSRFKVKKKKKEK